MDGQPDTAATLAAHILLAASYGGPGRWLTTQDIGFRIQLESASPAGLGSR